LTWLHRLVLMLAVAMLLPLAPARAETDFVRDLDGSLTFRQAELAFDTSRTMPDGGWEQREIPAPLLTEELKRRENGAMVLWARMRFEGSELPRGPIAFYTVNTRERFVLYFNGAEVFRNYSHDGDQVLGWNRPYFVELPHQLLREGSNEIAMRIDTGVFWHVGIGTVRVGSSPILKTEHGTVQFWRITGVIIAQSVMIASTAYALLLWLLGWRDRRALLWGAIGIFWLVRNLHFFVERPLFDPHLFREISNYLIYFVVALTYSFCAEVFDVKRRRLFNMLQYSFAAGICVLRYAIANKGLSDILLLISGGSVIYIAVRAWWASRKFDHLLILLGLVATALFSLHDLGRTMTAMTWDGIGFFLQPYAGFVMAWAFFVPIAVNIVRSFDATSRMNMVLEDKVREVSAALKASEAMLREQQVALAVNEERERLMREIHDGVGSNLVTALAIAEKQQHPPESVATLKRSLSDLKLTVDSLEAVDGDVVVLLANLRHRLEPDLRDAGLRTVWLVEPCPPMHWLNPVNALHLLRLIQEAIGNVLAHARASTISLQCLNREADGVPGVQIEIADDGIGFDPAKARGKGRGLRSMRSRAASLGGTIGFATSDSGGTRIEIWLPIEQRPARPPA
jgi:signal transduction histidine kinase